MTRNDHQPCTRLTLVRHAHIDTGRPPGRRLCGALDLPLSPRGWEQVHSFCHESSRRPRPDALYSSPLRRARDTAEALARAWQLELQVESRVAEIHCGTLEGIAIEQIQREHAALWAQNLAQNDDDFTWPGGESYRQFRQRVLEGLRWIAAHHPGERVVVVTHAGVVTQALGVIHQRAAAEWSHQRPRPFSATDITLVDGEPGSVISFDEQPWW